MSQAIIVVPCYNEARRLDVAEFRRFARDHRSLKFLFVDDGSTDATPEVLEELRLSDPESFLVRPLPENAGKAEAVRQGMLQALEAGPDYVGFWDADLATPLRAIPEFSAILESRPEIAMVFGTRIRLLGRSVERKPLRHLLGRLFATAASLTLGTRFYDTQCGAKLFRSSPEVASLFEAPFRTRWIFDVEVLARLISARRGTNRPPIDESVFEFPLLEWRDVAGSKLKARDYLNAFFGLASIRHFYRAKYRPAIRPRGPAFSRGPTRPAPALPSSIRAK